MIFSILFVEDICLLLNIINKQNLNSIFITPTYSKLNNFDDFFHSTNENIDTIFDNQIFAYHWHSRNNDIIEKNSYFEKFERKIHHKLENLICFPTLI